MSARPPTAVIADDEEHLRRHLAAKLVRLWPDLIIVAEAAHGEAARAAIEQHRPDLAFLDIRMPGLSGLEVARQTAGGPTRYVFVTAYDQYALDAFDREAVDYLVKPVSDERLTRSIERLRRLLGSEAAAQPDLARLLAQLLQSAAPQAQAAGPPAQGAAAMPGDPALPDLTAAAATAAAATAATATAAATSGTAPLRWIRASLGDLTRHVPVEEVRYFRSDDKYTVVCTADGDHLIRTPLAELLAQLDPEWFWQIHRSTVINMRHVAASRRDDSGRIFVQLRPDGLELPVSRAWVHRFRQM